MTKFDYTAHNVSLRPAATVILVRRFDAGLEVLLMKRGAGAPFMPNAFVFAGGAVDPHDSAEVYGHVTGLDDASASGLLDLKSDGMAFFVAAVREAFEECGLLLAYNAEHNLVDLSSWSESRLREVRSELSSGKLTLVQMCRDHGWRLALDRLYYFAHWITPVGLSKRFDTRFFLAQAPENQRACLGGDEMSEVIWRTPKQALLDHAASQILLMKATRAILNDLAEFQGFDTLMNFARQPRKVVAVQPVLQPNGKIL